MKFFILIIFIISAQFINLAQVPDELVYEVSELIAEVPAGTKMAILIYNPLTQDTIISINHTQSMIPASNTKLFTSATALGIDGWKLFDFNKNISG